MFKIKSVLFSFFVVFCSYAQAEDIIYMVSLGGDSVGNNGSYVLNNDEGLFFVNYLPVEQDLYRGDGFTLHFNGGVANSWDFDFVAPYELKIRDQREFVGSQAFPGQSPRKPGMRVRRAGAQVNNV